MKIIYSGLQYTNFDSALGFSFEHNNIYEFLKQASGIETIYFPYERILEVGRERGNVMLLELIKKEKPDMFFAFMFTDELLPLVLKQIERYTASVAWFSDDHWRFDNYSKYYAPYFSWIITTYSKAVERYLKIGAKNVIQSQWAANTAVYKPIIHNNTNIEVSFVGTWSKPRQKVVSALTEAGIKVDVFGNGWPKGRISFQKILEIFSNSKINLGLNPAPGYFNKNSLGRLILRRSMDKIVPDFDFLNNFKSWLNRGIPQIKARHFEIPACGGFLISGPAEDLGRYYKIDKEIVIYSSIQDLVEKIKYYLAHEGERKKIAEAGYQRTIQFHTYDKRFSEIFGKIKTKAPVLN